MIYYIADIYNLFVLSEPMKNKKFTRENIKVKSKLIIL